MWPTWREAVSNDIGQQLVENLYRFETEVVSLVQNLQNELRKQVEEEFQVLVCCEEHTCAGG